MRKIILLTIAIASLSSCAVSTTAYNSNRQDKAARSDDKPRHYELRHVDDKKNWPPLNPPAVYSERKI